MLQDTNESLDRHELSLKDWEQLLLDGWDRVGENFFRRRFDYYTIPFLGEDVTLSMQLMPLRYKLVSDFQFTKSQRIIMRKNDDLVKIYRPAVITEEKIALFDKWYAQRFNLSASLHTWVSDKQTPFPMYEVCLYKYDRLVACSFFDITSNLQYSTTAFYDPTEMKRSLGTFTLLCEIIHGLSNHKKYHYPGHAYYQKSMYEYKKHINHAEYYDWDLRHWVQLRD
jgi:arginyl-tRNA--protein-N-Asp/Glu arginylyltransferase